MPTKSEYEKTLDALCKMLKRQPMTARGIAKAFDCCKPVAYQRVQGLRDRGESVYTLDVRESAVGPTSTAYGVR